MRDVEIIYTERGLLGHYGGKPIKVTAEFADRMQRQGVAKVVNAVPDIRLTVPIVEDDKRPCVYWLNSSVHVPFADSLGIRITDSIKDCDMMVIDIRGKELGDRSVLIRLFDLRVPYALLVSQVMDAGLWDRQLATTAHGLIFYGEDIRTEYIRRYGAIQYCMSDDLWGIWRMIGGAIG